MVLFYGSDSTTGFRHEAYLAARFRATNTAQARVENVTSLRVCSSNYLRREIVLTKGLDGGAVSK